MTFKEYLIGKKNDSDKFEQSENALFQELSNYFSQLHPDSFTAQKLFLINPLRRKYLLKEITEEVKPKKVAAKPKFKKP